MSTIKAQYLQHFSASSAAITLDSAGKVGIGTSSPVAGLSISNPDNTKPVISFISNTNGQYPTTGATTGSIDNNFSGAAGEVGIWNNQTNATTSFVFRQQTGTSAKTDIMTLLPGGNVGIGTSSPSQKLEVAGQGLFKSGTNDFVNVFSDSGAMEICRSSGDAYIDFKNLSSEDYDCRIQSVGTGGIFGFCTNGFERMRIDGSGNVGVGTTSPGNTLQVQGSGDTQIRVSEITNTYYFDFGRNTSDGLFQINGNQGLGYKWLNNGTEAMRITSAGNVGIGTSSPVTRLNTNGGGIVVSSDGDYFGGGAYWGGSPANWRNTFNSEGGWVIRNTAGQLAILTGSNSGAAGSAFNSFPEAMRIDNSGNVGIGTSSPTFKLDISSGSLGTTAGNQILHQRLYSTSNNNDYLEITNTRVANGTDWNTGGTRIQQKIDSTWMAYIQFNGNNSGGLSFGTGFSTTSATSISEAMRIDSSGNLLLGVTSSPLTSTQVLYFDGSARQGLLIKNTVNNQSGAAVRFMDYLGNVSGGGIYYTSSNSINYATSSDYRLKIDINPMSGGLSRICALRPINYKWKIDTTDGEGFLAHELQAIIPKAVIGEKDAVNEDGSIKPQAVDYSKIVVHLVAAIQELKAENDELKQRITNLENK